MEYKIKLIFILSIMLILLINNSLAETTTEIKILTETARTDNFNMDNGNSGNNNEILKEIKDFKDHCEKII